MDKKTFSEWLLEQMTLKGWTQADLVKASGLTRTAISDYINQKRTNPEPQALAAIAKALQASPINVFRAAGLLPPERTGTKIIEDIIHLTSDLPESEQNEILAYIKMRKDRLEKRK